MEWIEGITLKEEEKEGEEEGEEGETKTDTLELEDRLMEPNPEEEDLEREMWEPWKDKSKMLKREM